MSTHTVKKIMHYIGVFAAMTVIFVAVFLTVARLTLSYAHNYQAVFEKWATKIVERPIHIKDVKGSWYGLNPVLSFQDVLMLNRKGTHALLRVKALRIGVDLVNSLIHWKLEPDYVEIDGSHIQLTQGKDGKIELNQIKEFSVAAQTQVEAASEKSFFRLIDWLFTRSSIVLKNLDVRWKGASQKQIYLRKLSAHIINDKDMHDIDGTFSFVRRDGTKVSFIAKFVGDVRAHYHIKTYLELRNVNIPSALKRKRLHKLNIQNGKINAKVWLSVKDNMLENIQADFDIKRLTLHSQVTNKLFRVNHFKANVSAEKENAAWRINADKVMLKTNGVKWPELRFAFKFIKRPEGIVWQNVEINYLNPSEFKKFILVTDFLSKKLVALFEPVNISGLVKNIAMNRDDSDQYKLNAQYKHLTIQGLKYSPQLIDLTGKIQLKKQQQQILSHFDFTSPYFSSLGDVKVQYEHPENPLLDVDVKLNFPDFSKLYVLLPPQYVSKSAASWLRRGLLSGKGSADLLIKGKARNFPFKNKPGQLEFNLAFDNVNLDFYKNWPQLKNLSGTLDLHNTDLKVIADKAIFANMPLTALVAKVKDVTHPHLIVDFKDQTDSQKLITFINATPLRDSVGKKLKLFNINSKVMLTTHIVTDFYRNNPPVEPVLRKPSFVPKSRRVAFEQRSVQETYMSSGKGDTTQGLSKNWLSLGGLRVRGKVAFIHGIIGVPELGLHIKDVNGALPFDGLHVNAKAIKGKLFNRPMTFSIKNIEKHEREALVIGAQAKLPISFWKKYLKTGVLNSFNGTANYHAQVTLWDDATPTTLRLTSNLRGVVIKLPAILNKPRGKSLPSSLMLYFDDKTLKKAHLNYGKSLEAQIQFRLSKRLASNRNRLRVPLLKQIHFNVDTSGIQGELLYRPSHYRGHLTGHFDYLNLEKLSHETSHFDPREIPKIDIVCDDFQYRDRPLGKFTLHLDPIINGVRFTQIRSHSPSLNFLAKGSWTVNHNKQHTGLKGAFNTTNLGKLLNDWNLTHNLARGRGRSNFNLSWEDRPQDFNVKTLSGKLNFQFNDGRVTNLPEKANRKLDIGRALSVFSLQTLPRRLSLNFRDLTHKGFSYDVMLGQFNIDKGVLKTQRAYLKGPVARVAVNGQIDMVKENYNILMTVTAYYMNGLPIVATLIGGPVAGIVTWVAGKVLKKPLHKLTTHKYAVTGNWAHPDWHAVKS